MIYRLKFSSQITNTKLQTEINIQKHLTLKPLNKGAFAC